LVTDNPSLVVVENLSLDEGFVVELEKQFVSILKKVNLEPNAVAVSLVTPERMRELNRDFHSVDAPTDVLSFPYADAQSQVSSEPFIMASELGNFLGDIALCTSIASKQAEEKGISLTDELAFLFAHGLEHLRGHHHE
jgi:probable rRNA maturation factor